VNQQPESAVLDALEHVRALLAAGVRLDQALAAAPDGLRDELAEALNALSRVEALAEDPARDFTARLERQMLAAVDDARAARGRRRGFFAAPLLWRLGAAAVAVVLAFGVSGFAAVQASDPTIPGDTLYPVKEAREAVKIFLARGDNRVARAHLDQLAHRQRELEIALERGAPPRTVLVLEQGVANAVGQIVNASLRMRTAGDPSAVALAAPALAGLRARVDDLAAAEDSPAIAITLRRMSNYLAGQERALRGDAPPEQRPRTTPTDVRPPRDATVRPR
jgi:hypothetical protein